MTCSVVECTRPAKGRGFCGIHYMRNWRYGDPLLVVGRAGPRPTTRIPIETRFWSKVDFSNPNGCWLWTGSRRHEYGEVWRDGRKMYAHRAAFELVYGPLQPGEEACHKCDTPLCMRPDHLFRGTQKDNMHDASMKGRMRNGVTGPAPGSRRARRNQRNKVASR